MKDLPTVSPAEIQRQLKKLGTNWKATKSNLIYATQRNLIPQPIEGHRGGAGVKSMRPGETAPEIYSNRELVKTMNDGGFSLTLDQGRIVRECGRELYDGFANMTPENSRRIINRLSDILEGKEFFAVPIMFWLHKRNMAIVQLYGEDAVQGWGLWSNPELATDLITYLSRGLMRDWSWDGAHFQRPIEKAQSPSDEIYTTGCAERASTALLAAQK